MKVSVDLRKDRKDRMGRYQIRLRGEDAKGLGRIKKMTGLWVLPADWDKGKQQVKPSNRAHAVINAKLAELSAGLEVAIIAGQRKVAPSNVDAHLCEVWRQWIAANKGAFSKATRKVMLVHPGSLEAYDAKVPLKAVDRNFLLSYGRWLQENNYEQNTVYDRVKRLRSIVTTLRQLHGLPAIDLKKLGFQWQDTGDKFLSTAEFTRLENWKPRKQAPRRFPYLRAEPSKWEFLSVKIWLFMLYTGGMRMGDALRVDRSWFRGNTLVHRNKKPPYKYREIPLLPQAKAIADLFPGKRLWDLKDTEGTRTQLNEGIKRVCAQVGIDKPVSMHWARHSSAEFLHGRGVSDRSICMIMGISLKTLQTYYWSKWKRDMAGEEMSKAWKVSA